MNHTICFKIGFFFWYYRKYILLRELLQSRDNDMLKYNFSVWDLSIIRLDYLFSCELCYEYTSTLHKNRISLYKRACLMILWLRAWLNTVWLTIHVSLNSTYDMILMSVQLYWIINKRSPQEAEIQCEYPLPVTHIDQRQIYSDISFHSLI